MVSHGDSRRKQRRIAALQLVLWLLPTALALAPALRADFIWDDFRQVVRSEQVRRLDSIPGYFTHHVWELEEGFDAAEGVRLYRPVFQTALALQYRLWGGASAAGFHLGSLLTHLMVTLLLWLLARRWLGGGGWPAVAVALMFGMHPVTAESYAWISALTDLLAALGMLAALLLVERCGAADDRAPPSHGIRWGLAAGAGGLFLLGLLAKEVALLALPAITAWMVLGRRVPMRFLGPMWVAGALFMGARMAALGGLEATGRDVQQMVTALHHLPILIVDGLRALVLMRPVGYRGLAYEYEALGWWVSLAAVAVLAAAVVAAWRWRRPAPLLSLALAVHGLVVAPVALVATVPGWGGFGRYLYIPAVFVTLGLVQAAAAMATSLDRGQSARRLMAAGAAAGLVYLGIQQVSLRTALRAYSDPEQLAQSAISNAPEVGVGYELYGHVLMDRGDLPGAIESYQSALGYTPGLLEATTNLGLALIHTGRPEEGLELMQAREAEKAPGPRSSYVVALALLHLGRVDEAAERLVWAIQRAPGDADLGWLQREVLVRHPDPVAYRVWLEAELAMPENAAAEGVIRPWIEDPGAGSKTAP